MENEDYTKIKGLWGSIYADDNFGFFIVDESYVNENYINECKTLPAAIQFMKGDGVAVLLATETDTKHYLLSIKEVIDLTHNLNKFCNDFVNVAEERKSACDCVEKSYKDWEPCIFSKTGGW